MKKHNIFIYPLEGKVIFPYHEYRFSINSHAYQRNTLSYSAEVYDNLIGFVSKLDDIKDNKSI
jgi:hypothetical protein